MPTLFINSRQKAAKSLQLDLVRLRDEIEQTREEIDAARNHFEHAVDPTLIDCYIYEINAAQLRYQFLRRRFKAVESRFPGELLID